ncbi:MAG TPA: uracil-DNA glycosylase [Gemmataceae bacterium]|nr:uracil-DNA glycosylase [Gemmataceae bacterium]
MADNSGDEHQRLRRQARQQVESLRLAGVEWLPLAARAVADPAAAVRETLEEEPGRPSRARSTNAEIASPSRLACAEGELFSEEVPGPAALEERRKALAVLAETVALCTRCKGLAATRTQTVFGVGKVGVDLCFVGEAPGADEDAQGEPFVGAAGQLLNRIIAACQMKREDVYICNIIKCRPPGNRLPLVDEVANCREYLAKQIELVRPRFLCALGSTAAQNLLGTTQSIGKLRGRFHSFKGIPTICTYHPAYLLPHRSPEKKKDVWEDMKMLLSRMGRPIA